MKDLDEGQMYNRARRARITPRYSKVSVNPSNVTPIANRTNNIKS